MVERLHGRSERVVISGAIGGPLVELDLRTLYLEDLTLIGATITAPSVFAELVRLIEAGAIQPAVAATFPLAQIKAESFVVMEYPTLQVVTGNRFKNTAEIASLTKIMTFYTAYQIAAERSIDVGACFTTIDE